MTSLNKLFKKLWDTGTVNRRPGSGRPLSARTEENAKLLQKFPQSATERRLSGEVTENTFLSVKKTKSMADCGNFWSRSLARFMRAAQFASVSSCARHLLKHFRCKSLQIVWDTDDRWIPVSLISHGQSCGSAAWPLDSGLAHTCLHVFFCAGTNWWQK